MKTKQTKTQRIAALERELLEAKAGRASQYHFASAALAKAGVDCLTGSGVILTLTVIGGRELLAPVMVWDGLSAETITALKADLARSYELAVLLKPEGAK